MTRKKASRADSTHNLTNFDVLNVAIPAHITLLERDLPFWNAIVRARASETWTDVDYNHAANLARCQADIEQIQMELRNEGSTLVNERGTVVVNPKHTILETLSRRSIALSKAVKVHAEATVGQSQKLVGKNQKQKEKLNTLAKVEKQSLLAQLPVH